MDDGRTTLVNDPRRTAEDGQHAEAQWTVGGRYPPVVDIAPGNASQSLKHRAA